MRWWLGVQMITVHRWFDADLVADDSSVRLWTNLIPSFSPGCCRELQVNVFEPQQYQSVFCVWRVRGVCESGLPLAYVPVQTLSQTFKPVIHQVVTTDRWHRITGGRDLNTVGRRTDGRIILKLREKSICSESVTDVDTCAYQSPCWISCLFLPSNDTQAVFLASGDNVICFKEGEDRLSVLELKQHQPGEQLHFTFKAFSNQHWQTYGWEQRARHSFCEHLAMNQSTNAKTAVVTR